VPGTPKARAAARYRDHVDVRVPYSLRGVEAYLVVPMWYGEATVYARGQEATSLLVAVQGKSVIWSAGQGSAIDYHFEDRYFVLDRLQVR
jgi:hypothetical protein